MRYSLILTVTIFPVLVFAHGEDKPGPHGGYIRMPGAFHTEVLPVSGNQFQVFLLDVDWKKPSITKSSIEARVEANSQKFSAKCIVQADHFLCSLPQNVNLKKKGTLRIIAEREGQSGGEVIYDLPIRLQVVDDGHGKHK